MMNAASSAMITIAALVMASLRASVEISAASATALSTSSFSTVA